MVKLPSFNDLSTKRRKVLVEFFMAEFQVPRDEAMESLNKCGKRDLQAHLDVAENGHGYP